MSTAFSLHLVLPLQIRESGFCARVYAADMGDLQMNPDLRVGGEEAARKARVVEMWAEFEAVPILKCGREPLCGRTGEGPGSGRGG